MPDGTLTEELSAATGGSPTPAQVAELAGASVEDVLAAREAYRCCTPSRWTGRARRRRAKGEGLTLLETLPDDNPDLPHALDRVALDAMLARLDERERLIVHLYYREELTQAEIGRRLGYSQMHISRLLRRAGERLQLAA